MALSADRAYPAASGARWEDLPRPHVAVDTAVLTVRLDADSSRRDCVQVLLIDDTVRERMLPGGFLLTGETLEEAARRVLLAKTGLRSRQLEQLRTFDNPERDTRGRVLSVGHLDVVRYDDLVESITELNDAHPERQLVLEDVDEFLEDPRSLPYDHALIVATAVARLRADAQVRANPFGLIRDGFTLREFRRVHEAINPELGLSKDTLVQRYRDEFEPLTDEPISDGSRGRPARRFRWRTAEERDDALRRRARRSPSRDFRYSTASSRTDRKTAGPQNDATGLAEDIDMEALQEMVELFKLQSAVRRPPTDFLRWLRDADSASNQSV
ncbi:MAG TPA: hypothetical protein DHW34_01750 [Actinobacteria bacterium]|nr:hypothetical protein [Actinomycetota bacterium]HCK78720.1 hypothetical protein [Actinomycetota bacterium]